MLPSTPRTFVGSTTLTVRGLGCGRCRQAVTDLVTAVPGVRAVSLDPGCDTVTVQVTEPVDRADIAEAVRQAGCIPID